MTGSKNHGTKEGSDTVQLTESEHHRVLASERRRIALGVLMDRSAPVDLEKLARAVTGRERGLEATDTEAWERVKVTLHHCHLPRLVEAGIIAYDLHETRVVSCPSRDDISVR